MITDGARAKYLREPDHCPFCGEANMLTSDKGQLSSLCCSNECEHIFECGECGKQWIDCWRAVSVEEVQ